jgi:dihydroorotate dehydrogenase (fumarate)
MADLKTTFMGLEMANPVVVASSNLTSSLKKLKNCEKAGAGAVVLKSLFEEQILSDTQKVMTDSGYQAHAEGMDYLFGMGTDYHINEYLKLIKQAKAELSMPVIASINCISGGAWIEYAESIEKAGADALELNVFLIPASVSQSGEEIERIYFDIVRKIKRRIKIPIAMKIGPHFSGLAHTIKALSEEGIDGLVLFNRFYRPDVDIEALKLVAADILSTPQEMNLSLQWIALLSGEVECDFAATTGVHDSAGVIKQLLVGAKAVQLCSVLYRNTVAYIKDILTQLEDWMDKHNFNRIEDFCGKLCQEASEHPEAYERSQYIKALVGIS